MPPPFPKSLQQLLKSVSRSFYLTLWVLPAEIRPQIGLAYLLARTTDTIADTGVVTLERRIESLHALRDRIQRLRSDPVQFGDFAESQGSPAERLLLERHEELLSVLDGCSPSDRKLIEEVVTIITSGQELDLTRFGGASPQAIVPLRNDTELDDYTYRVAGCVGEFWTKMCRAHLFPNAALDDRSLLANGVRFGQGLQLVNILRDLPADLRLGRCYLPAEALSRHGVSPPDLLSPTTESRLRPLYNAYLAKAEDHLAAGWVYTNTLPHTCLRVRLACAWPILIGVKTIDRLKTDNFLNPQKRVKISRAEVRQIMLRSVLLLPWPKAWQRLFKAAIRTA
jgi:farnesyl-diphosphate farnesyltransferase